MAVGVLIKDKRILKKKLRIEDFILDGMSYGIIDSNFRLDEGKLGTNIVVFDKKDIIRGFEISLSDNGVNLYMSLPTSDAEIKRFYDYIKKICEMLHTKTFIREEEEMNLVDIDGCIDIDIKTSIDALESMEKNIKNNEYKSMYIFGVYNPISLGKKEIEFINRDPKKLGELLHKLQSIDAYYAVPQVFVREENDYLGVYTLLPNVQTIYPFEPTVFMNEDIKVNKWEIIIVAGDNVSGTMDYSKFIENVDKSNIYDADHFLIEVDDKLLDKLTKFIKER